MINGSRGTRKLQQSRLCRLLGTPVVFAIVQLLAENKEMSPGEIARAIARSVPRVSNVLAALRLAEVMRYETAGRRTKYRLKHPHEIRKLLGTLDAFVKSALGTGLDLTRQRSSKNRSTLRSVGRVLGPTG